MKDYRAHLEKVLRDDPELGEHLRITQAVLDNLHSVVVKQDTAITYTMIGALMQGPQTTVSHQEAKELSESERRGVGGHVLYLGDPGRGKTVLCESFAKLIKAKYARIQCTPELEPTGIFGMETERHGQWVYRRGPIYSNILLVDEINRAPQKTQSALLQAMAEGEVERDVLGDGVMRREVLPRPFFVVATMNPIEQEGVYPLPEAQLDRFAMQITMTGIGIQDIMKVVQLNEEVYGKRFLEPVATAQDILNARQFISDNVIAIPPIRRYAARLAKALIPFNDMPYDEMEEDREFEAARKIIRATPLYLAGKLYKVSDIVGMPERPYEISEIAVKAMYERMSILAVFASRVHAFLCGRRFVLPKDVRKVFGKVSPHRIFLKPQAEGLLQRKIVTANDRILDRAELTHQLARLVITHMPIPLMEAPHEPR